MKAIFCLPDYGFDPTEAAVPFEMFLSKGWEVSVATEHGQKSRFSARTACSPICIGNIAACDSRMMEGWLSKLAVRLESPLSPLNPSSVMTRIS